MVHVHAAKHAFERPDPSRIAALSGAMLLNLAGLMLLLIPIVMPSAPPRIEEPTIEVYFPPEPVPIQPVPPMPEAAQLPQRPRPVAQPQPQPTPDTRPVFTETARPEVVAPALPVDPNVEQPVFNSGPIEAGALQTIVATAPRYPIKALRAGVEGTVYLRILVGTDGMPMRVEIDRSSGSRELDAEAKRHVVKKWRFVPAMRDGVPVQAWGRVPIVFSLARG
jgi:periplasmic protein TonB